MLYQKLLMGETPYMLSCGYHNESGFQEHRHPEAEFIYCRDGSFDLKIGKQTYTVTEGSLIIVAPMEAHEVIYNEQGCFTVVIEVGPSLLRKKFKAFSDGRISSALKSLDGSTDNLVNLQKALEETVSLYNRQDEFCEFIITGNIYKICGYILAEYSQSSHEMTMDLKAVANIEKALEMIHNRYAEPITVDMAAEATGYGKSNFCKIFKKITGETFHNVLNRQRVETACVYLDETTMSVSKIAAAVGFSETKCFCRVFKNIMGITPGERRKTAERE